MKRNLRKNLFHFLINLKNNFCNILLENSILINKTNVNNQAKYAYLLEGCVNKRTECCKITDKNNAYVNKFCL